MVDPARLMKHTSAAPPCPSVESWRFPHLFLGECGKRHESTEGVSEAAMQNGMSSESPAGDGPVDPPSSGRWVAWDLPDSTVA